MSIQQSNFKNDLSYIEIVLALSKNPFETLIQTIHVMDNLQNKEEP